MLPKTFHSVLDAASHSRSTAKLVPSLMNQSSSLPPASLLVLVPVAWLSGQAKWCPVKIQPNPSRILMLQGLRTLAPSSYVALHRQFIRPDQVVEVHRMSRVPAGVVPEAS